MHVRILAGKLDRTAGSHVYHYELAQRLSSAGHDVSLVFFKSAHAPLPSLETLELPDTSFQHHPLIWRINPVLRYLAYGKKLRTHPLSRPDIVIGGEHLLLKQHYHLFPDVPWIYLPHSLTVSDEITHYNLERSLHAVTLLLYKHLQAWALIHSNRILRFTCAGCDALRIAYPKKTLAPFFINPIGIDAPAHLDRSTHTAHLRLLIVSSLIPRKGIDLALQALASLTEFPWSLNIIGDGGDRQKLEHMATALGISARVSFIGQIPDPTPWYQNSDLLLFPSRSESLGLVILEAMGNGTPCLAFRSDGAIFRNVNEELITHQEDGLLADSLDDFRKQLKSVFHQPETLLGLGRAARSKVLRCFQWQQHVKRYEELFLTLTSTRHSQAH
jgi:glycosyltransferase involved in cell wall biosynthesis